MHRYKAVTSCAWSGFGAVPAGHRNYNGSQFYNRGLNVNYWSSSVGSSTNAWYRNFNYDNAQVNRNNSYRSNGLSVRCVRESKKEQAPKRSSAAITRGATSFQACKIAFNLPQPPPKFPPLWGGCFGFASQ